MAPPAIVGLLIVTPRRAHADALVRALESGFGLRRVVGAIGQADAVASAVAHRPTVVLIDFDTEELEPCIRAMRRVAPSAPVVVYGVGHAAGTGERLIRAAQAGASSFLDAEQLLDDIVPALELALGGDSYCSPRVAGHLLHAIHLIRLGIPTAGAAEDRGAGSVLSHRERVVAELVASGLTNRQIANRLVVAEATVKSHVHAILRKLGISRREEVRIWFDRARTPVGVEAQPVSG